MAEETKEEQPKYNPVDDRISQANAAAIRLEQATQKMKETLQQMQAEKAEAILAGQADAGTNQPATKEELEIAEARKMLAGTGYEDLDLSNT